MQLKAYTLDRNLSREICPLYVLSGDEPLALEESADLIRAAARREGYTDRVRLQVEAGFEWSVLSEYRDAMGLFADKRLVELRIPGGKPGLDGAKALTHYAERPNPDNVLLVVAAGLNGADRRAKWYQALEGAGAGVVVYPVKVQELPGWIVQRAGKLGLELTDEAVALLAERTEGNQLSCDQELQKLHMLHGEGEIDALQVLESSSMSSRYSVYGMAQAALDGNAARACRMLRGLREEGTAVPLVMWVLASEIRAAAQIAAAVERGTPMSQAFRQARVWGEREPVLAKALRRRHTTGWYLMLKRAAQTDNAVKGGSRADPWDELERLVLALCGIYVTVPARARRTAARAS